MSVFVIRPSVLRVHSHRSTTPPLPAHRTPHPAPTLVDSLHERRVVDIPAAGFPELGGDQREIVVAEVQVEEVQDSSELQFGDHARVGGRPVEVLEVRVDEDSTTTHLIAKSAHDVDAPRFVVADEGEALTGQTGRVWGDGAGKRVSGWGMGRLMGEVAGCGRQWVCRVLRWSRGELRWVLGSVTKSYGRIVL